MPDEPIANPVVEQPTGAAEATAPVAIPEIDPAKLDWEIIAKALDHVPVEKLRQHSRFSGTVGEAVQRAVAAKEAEWKAEQAARERDAEEERLRQLRRNDPLRYAEEQEQRDQQAQVQRESERQMSEIAEAIGSSVTAIPEWGEVTPEQFQRLREAVTGKAGKDLFKAFNATAADILSDIRAAKRADAWRAKDLAQEREAIQKEERAKLLSQDRSPDMARAQAYPTSDEPDFKDRKAWNRWYERTKLGRS